VDLRNVGKRLSDCTALHPRRQPSSYAIKFVYFVFNRSGTIFKTLLPYDFVWLLSVLYYRLLCVRARA
jgi:hypothetical protein